MSHRSTYRWPFFVAVPPVFRAAPNGRGWGPGSHTSALNGISSNFSLRSGLSNGVLGFVVAPLAPCIQTIMLRCASGGRDAHGAARLCGPDDISCSEGAAAPFRWPDKALRPTVRHQNQRDIAALRRPAELRALRQPRLTSIRWWRRRCRTSDTCRCAPA